MLIGMINDPSSKFDPNVADTLQNRLFEFSVGDGTVVAVDLVATNINRGRDHGIPDFNSAREKCGMRKATTFDDLRGTIPDDRLQVLSSVYQ
jgi:peroxidase